MDIVGFRANNHGRTCARHDCFGNQVERGVKVKVIKERMKYRGDEEDDVLQITGGAIWTTWWAAWVRFRCSSVRNF